ARRSRDRLPRHQLREAGVRLVDEGELLLLEALQPLLPRDGLERFDAAVTGVVDAENAWVVAASRAFYVSGHAPSRLDPSSDLRGLVVIFVAFRLAAMKPLFRPSRADSTLVALPADGASEDG